MLLAIAGFCGNSCACEGDVDRWSNEFKLLRSVHGHFDGGAWTASVDRWGGHKHQLMQCLAARAGATSVPTDRLKAWMGLPDTVQRCPSPSCDAVTREIEGTSDARSAPGNTARSQLWVYHWRGVHDRLVFTVERGKVTGARWAYVHE